MYWFTILFNLNKQIRRIDLPRRTGFVDWWEVKMNLGKGVCELYIKVNLPVKFHADIFCSH